MSLSQRTKFIFVVMFYKQALLYCVRHAKKSICFNITAEAFCKKYVTT